MNLSPLLFDSWQAIPSPRSGPTLGSASSQVGYFSVINEVAAIFQRLSSRAIPGSANQTALTRPRIRMVAFADQLADSFLNLFPTNR
jgi:hypothetical protein